MQFADALRRLLASADEGRERSKIPKGTIPFGTPYSIAEPPVTIQHASSAASTAPVHTLRVRR